MAVHEVLANTEARVRPGAEAGVTEDHTSRLEGGGRAGACAAPADVREVVVQTVEGAAGVIAARPCKIVGTGSPIQHVVRIRHLLCRCVCMACYEAPTESSSGGTFPVNAEIVRVALPSSAVRHKAGVGQL